MNGLRPLTALALAGAIGCKIELDGFRCQEVDQCIDGAGHQGVCESDRYCSFADESCPQSRRRYGTYSGPRSGTCVVDGAPSSDAGSDAAADGGLDAAADGSADAAADGGLDAAADGSADAAADGGLIFVEDFKWSGPHAAMLMDADGGQPIGNTVFWNPDNWDTRVGMSYLAYAFHPTIDVRKASEPSTAGAPLEGYCGASGDGCKPPAPGGHGVGVMHFNDWGLATARLRNPGLISKDRPLAVSFYSNAIVTAGHWWEVIFTPSNPAVSAENTSDTFSVDGLTEFVSVRFGGLPAFPCDDGWTAAIEIRSAIGIEGTDHWESPLSLEPHLPSDRERLQAYEVALWPTGVEVRRDLNDDGIPENLMADSKFNIPWPEASVHLLGLAANASAYPDDSRCGDYFSAERLISWRAVRVSPVKYRQTLALPRQRGTDRTAQAMQWTTFDLRDLEHIGVAAGLPQPNSTLFDLLAPGVACGGTGIGHCTAPSNRRSLALVQEVDVAGLSAASLVYDIRGDGTADLSVNGASAGRLPGAASAIKLNESNASLWVRRSLSIPPSMIQQGDGNTFLLVLDGNVELDRFELELGY